jgi:hypothetical protein
LCFASRLRRAIFALNWRSFRCARRRFLDPFFLRETFFESAPLAALLVVGHLRQVEDRAVGKHQGVDHPEVAAKLHRVGISRKIDRIFDL